MKGLFLQRPLEFALLVQGESWKQGDSIEGAVTVKNHGSETISLEGTLVSLAYGDLKKVRLKDPKAFSVIATTTASEKTVDAQKSVTFPWKFQTERNSPITDKSGSFFLLYGKPPTAGQFDNLGQLQLTLLPDPIIQEFLKVVQTDFRFVPKSQKSSKGWVEIKLDPPDSKAFAAVDQLLMSFQFDGAQLNVKYQFMIRKLEASAAAMDMKKEKKDFAQSFEPNQYLTPSGRFQFERIEAAFNEIISQLGLGTFVGGV